MGSFCGDLLGGVSVKRLTHASQYESINGHIRKHKKSFDTLLLVYKVHDSYNDNLP